VAIGLAAFSGLRPAELKKLMIRDFVDLSLPVLQFSVVPSRINVRNQRTFQEFYTFLSTEDCLDLVADLKTRAVSQNSVAVTEPTFRAADKMIHASDMRWLDLRQYFRACFLLADSRLPQAAVSFMAGYAAGKEDQFFNFFSPKTVQLMRQGYAQVEKQSFVRQTITHHVLTRCQVGKY